MSILRPRIRYVKIEVSSKNDGFMHKFGVQCLIIKDIQLNYVNLRQLYVNSKWKAIKSGDICFVEYHSGFLFCKQAWEG